MDDAAYRSNAIKACARWLSQGVTAFSQNSRLAFKVDPQTGAACAVAAGGNIGVGTVLLSVPMSKCLHPGHEDLDYGMKVVMEKVRAGATKSPELLVYAFEPMKCVASAHPHVCMRIETLLLLK
jgi:hypothetical protein